LPLLGGAGAPPKGGSVVVECVAEIIRVNWLCIDELQWMHNVARSLVCVVYISACGKVKGPTMYFWNTITDEDIHQPQ
jgi:hypothetical protein